MQISIRSLVTSIPLLGAVDASFRDECVYEGPAVFNTIKNRPWLSTFCPSLKGEQICTMLDLGYCMGNSNGHLVPVVNGGYDRSCKDCKLTGANGTTFICSCQMFGKDAPWRDAEIELEPIVRNLDGYLTCWDSPPQACPGFFD